jgi:hypothetical protein
MSLALLECKQQVRVPRTSAKLLLRIGIHTGIYFSDISRRLQRKIHIKPFFYVIIIAFL